MYPRSEGSLDCIQVFCPIPSCSPLDKPKPDIQKEEKRTWEDKLLNFMGFGKNVEDKPQDSLQASSSKTETEVSNQSSTVSPTEVPVKKEDLPDTVVQPVTESVTPSKPENSEDTSVATAAATTTTTTTTSTTTSATTTSTSVTGPTATTTATGDKPLKVKILPFPPTTDWPWDLVAICVISGVLLIYSYFSVTDTKLDAMADEIRWGGEANQLKCFHKLNIWLKFERKLLSDFFTFNLQMCRDRYEGYLQVHAVWYC